MRTTRLASAATEAALAWLSALQPGAAATAVASIVGSTPEEFAAYAKAAIGTFERIGREGHITVQ